MGRHCSTGQSQQWAVVPMEEEEDPHTTRFIVMLIAMRNPIRKNTTDALIN